MSMNMSEIKGSENKVMTEEDREYLLQTIEGEGFWYAFESYSDFLDIKDTKFHELRGELLKVGEELTNYIEGESEGEVA